MAELNAKNILARVHWIEGRHEFSLVERTVSIVIAEAAEFFGSAVRRQ